MHVGDFLRSGRRRWRRAASLLGLGTGSMATVLLVGNMKACLMNTLLVAGENLMMEDGSSKLSSAQRRWSNLLYSVLCTRTSTRTWRACIRVLRRHCRHWWVGSSDTKGRAEAGSGLLRHGKIRPAKIQV